MADTSYSAGDELRASLNFLLQGGATAKDLPAHGTPEVLGWFMPDGSALPTGPAVFPQGEPDHVVLKLRYPDDFALKLSVVVQAPSQEASS